MTEDEIIARDSSRDIGAELLQALKELGAGKYSRKTTYETLKDLRILRKVIRADGTVEKEEILTGPRWATMAARATSGLSQSAFARALGVSKRTLENWEQGRATPSGAARRLLALAAQYPDTVARLAALEDR